MAPRRRHEVVEDDIREEVTIDGIETCLKLR